MSGVDGGGLSAEVWAQVYYEAEGWSGCAGSSWEKLTEATRDGWRHAARLAALVAAVEQIAERESAIAVAREHHRMVAFVEAAERERDDQIEKVRRLDADYQRLAEESRQDAAALAARARAEGEVAGQMKHITAEVARGDQPLEEKEELIADLRARLSHVEAERDEWKARRDRAVETCRFRHQEGLTAEEWHAKICGAMQGVQQERARAEAAEQRADRVTAAVEALRKEWRALPVWGPDERGLHILDGVDLEGLMSDLDAALADPAPREYDDGGPRVREAVERAEREFPTCLPSLGEPCGNCHRCAATTEGDQP